ncbi:MAG: spore coat protein CotJB [Enterocloster sp.]
MDNNMDRMQLMKEIGEASFMVNDLTLYLDTHPTDQEALKAFSEASKKRRELMEICADQFEPLTMDLVCPDTATTEQKSHKYPDPKHFTWSDGPMPWEGGAL